VIINKASVTAMFTCSYYCSVKSYKALSGVPQQQQQQQKHGGKSDAKTSEVCTSVRSHCNV